MSLALLIGVVVFVLSSVFFTVAIVTVAAIHRTPEEQEKEDLEQELFLKNYSERKQQKTQMS